MPYYQPETAYQIFNRVTFNKDVATGDKSSDGYASSGASSAWTTGIEAPAFGSFSQDCYLWDVLESCTPDQGKVLKSGKPIVENFILIGYKADNGTEVYYPGHGKRAAANSTTTATPTTVPTSIPGRSAGMTLAAGPSTAGLMAVVAALYML